MVLPVCGVVPRSAGDYLKLYSTTSFALSCFFSSKYSLICVPYLALALLRSCEVSTMADEKRHTGTDSPVSDPEKTSPLHDEDISHVQERSPVNDKHTFTHHDPNWDGNDVDFSHVDEKAVLRKMDLRLLPMLALLYLLSFLDRGNIGNAKIEGLTETLHMTGPEYNWCLTVFFFTYCAFEVPSNLM